MKERPILFSGPMVRALLAGTKTQTRRVVKPQPQHIEWFAHQNGWCARVRDEAVQWEMVRCPFGVPGDLLWVKETFAAWCGGLSSDGEEWDLIEGPLGLEQHPPSWVTYAATPGDDRPDRWRPSIFMPRALSRITLKITDVRVQRLQDINEEDARAEGVFREVEITDGWAKLAYARLWDSINGAGAWDANPWVWAISFKRVQP